LGLGFDRHLLKLVPTPAAKGLAKVHRKYSKMKLFTKLCNGGLLRAFLHTLSRELTIHNLARGSSCPNPLRSCFRRGVGEGVDKWVVVFVGRCEGAKGAVTLFVSSQGFDAVGAE
jgi:hypothetical protein